MPHRIDTRVALLLVAALLGGYRANAAEPNLERFHREVQPLLEKYCYDCHGDGTEKGGVSLDGFTKASELRDPKLWQRALKNVRANIMPPAKKDQPTAVEAETLMEWMKREGLGLDLAHPDPGRVTVRRLNRVEYRNTIRDLLGVDYDTQKEFPADDTGHGFDNIGDVLTLSPILLEKYLDAAQAVVTKAVPIHSRVVPEQVIVGKNFSTIKADTTPPAPAVIEAMAAATSSSANETSSAEPRRRNRNNGAAPAAAARAPMRPVPTVAGEALDLSYYTPATVAAKHRVGVDGKYQLLVDFNAVEKYLDNQFDVNHCRLILAADGETVFEREFVREGDRKFEFTVDRDWKAGEHTLTFEIQPIAPEQPHLRSLRIRVNAVTVRGPLDPKYWMKPANYAQFFPRDVPTSASERHAYARELIERFAFRAFRHPVDAASLDRLVALAEKVSAQQNDHFEAGIAQAMVAVLASPRFIFREEETESLAAGQRYANVDEYALASRLSYFLWSSMPDEELFRLAGKHQLRANLSVQVTRMLQSPKSKEFVRNFTGQWLQARDVASVPINAGDILLREHPDPAFEQARATFLRLQPLSPRERSAADNAALEKSRLAFREFNNRPKPQLTDELRNAMQRETEMTFAYVLKEDRSLLELIESNYTFLNEDLAKHYGIADVTGSTMRKVTLSADSPRGGVLTQGTTLAVTSNPTRTSPVKRGVLILDAILGTPPAPPPPNIPALEDVAAPADRTLSLRETLAVHAKDAVCRSCHSRMDPLGLALENFNAMGAWRTTELNQPIETAGTLITGESFTDIRQLKHILATNRHRDFYYCISEKLLTYALGRGVEYYDTDTLDQLVAKLEASGGRPSVLLQGIIASAPFQQRRNLDSNSKAPDPRVSAVSKIPKKSP